jgi:hypothetical protein
MFVHVVGDCVQKDGNRFLLDRLPGLSGFRPPKPVGI